VVIHWRSGHPVIWEYENPATTLSFTDHWPLATDVAYCWTNVTFPENIECSRLGSGEVCVPWRRAVASNVKHDFSGYNPALVGK